MNFSNSRDQTLLSLWESVRRQVLADRANGGRSRIVGDNLRVVARPTMRLFCAEASKRNAWPGGVTSFQPIADLVQSRVRATVVEIGPWRSCCAN